MKVLSGSSSKILILVAFVFTFFAVILCVPQSTSAAASAKKGEATFSQKCAMCHGANGSGDTSMGKSLKLRDLRSKAVQAMSDSQLYDIIDKGKSPMPAYGSLGKPAINDLVAYIRELGKKK
jgi:cytochrome c6